MRIIEAKKQPFSFFQIDFNHNSFNIWAEIQMYSSTWYMIAYKENQTTPFIVSIFPKRGLETTYNELPNRKGLIYFCFRD